MDGDAIWRNTSLDELLVAGKEAFLAGDHDGAHDLWRAAAVANPYDERVWTSLLEVLTHEEDREVCLENIIAINPLNPDARRQLRALRREHRLREGGTAAEAPVARSPKRKASVKALPRSRAVPKRERGVLARAILTGILIGLVAVLLGVIASIVVFGGVLSSVTI